MRPTAYANNCVAVLFLNYRADFVSLCFMCCLDCFTSVVIHKMVLFSNLSGSNSKILKMSILLHKLKENRNSARKNWKIRQLFLPWIPLNFKLMPNICIRYNIGLKHTVLHLETFTSIQLFSKCIIIQQHTKLQWNKSIHATSNVS